MSPGFLRVRATGRWFAPILVSHSLHPYYNSHNHRAGYPELLDSCLLGIGAVLFPNFHYLFILANCCTLAVLGPIWPGAASQVQYPSCTFCRCYPRGARPSAREGPRGLLVPRVRFCVRRSNRRSVSPASLLETIFNPSIGSSAGTAAFQAYLADCSDPGTRFACLPFLLIDRTLNTDYADRVFFHEFMGCSSLARRWGQV